MRVITANVNGIRSAFRKGFFIWLAAQEADVVCLQETKAQMNDLLDENLRLPGYFSYFHDAKKKGYSGVAIYTRQEPDQVRFGLGFPCADTEGRYVQADFGQLSLASLYLPSGSSGDHRQAFKYDFMSEYYKQLKVIASGSRSFIIAGDWNIAHQPVDLENWRANQKNSGFLPEERAWLDKLLDELGWVDAFRVLNQSPSHYTWWSMRSRTARHNNVGWRIDYQMVTPDLKEKIKSVAIYTREFFSDHAPLIVDYDV